MSEVLVDIEQLVMFATEVLLSYGVPREDAGLVADSLVTADLWGHQSHGVLRLPWYSARLQAGSMKSVTEVETIIDSRAVAVLDGHDGIGQVLASRAMREAIKRAKAFGVGVVAVRNSNHFGTAAYFTRLAPPAGCIALLTSNTSPAMAPWGGRERIVGNNPWSIAAPGGQRGEVVMDLANTVVARGKIYLARQRNEAIPEGWAISADGLPTVDPQEAIDGIILPMAGHKGYAISLMMDVLSGVLSGSSFGTGVTGPYQAERRSGAGHLAVAFNVEAFQPVDEFNARMDTLLDEVKAVAPAAGFDEIFYPGELEERSAARAREDGLHLPTQTVEDLKKLALVTGVPVSFVAG